MMVYQDKTIGVYRKIHLFQKEKKSEIEPDRSDNKRINEFNDLLKDRRTEFYQSICESQ